MNKSWYLNTNATLNRVKNSMLPYKKKHLKSEFINKLATSKVKYIFCPGSPWTINYLLILHVINRMQSFWGDSDLQAYYQ